MGTIKPVTYIRPMSRGKSSPHLIACSDGRRYVVKFKNNPQGDWVLINEFIVNHLGALLELPIPRYKTIRITKQFIEEYDELRSKSFRSGRQSASRFVERALHVTDLDSRPKRHEIKNVDQVPGLIVFDHYTSNSDRNEKNLLLVPKGNQYVFQMIDHTNCFNITPDNPSREFLPLSVRRGKVFRWFHTLITHKKQLMDYVDKITAIHNDDLRHIIDMLPDDWNVSDSYQEALYKHLKYAKKALPGVMREYIDKNNI
ncbi:HipA family kinase [Paenibacillus hexagrammi]|uniref:HipA-like kinase domain-containing protein n=1 Tax=Paenibacillus hexagrammi TaxID=2908839 RepID=A0ABY3SFY0_9BACL|nr:HipA family kinase [Paenibacillus sp. YPD9-1]UJF32106.1 hypothetical protein L0M14_20560 [Paenibacillus sp. YPD9-1]